MIRLGAIRLWCPETIQEVIGIDEHHVVVRGHASLFVWDHHDGTRANIDPASIARGDRASCRVDVGDRNHVAVSVDGRWVGAASFGNRVRVWNNETGEQRFPDDPEYAYDDVAFSLDGTRVVGSADGAYVWDLATREFTRIPEAVIGARLDGNGDVVAAVARGRVARWSLDGREQVRVSVRHKVDSFTVSSDARYAAITTICTYGLCMDGLPDIVVADLARGSAILRFHDPEPNPGSRRAVLSPDAKWLALVDRGIRILSAAPRPAWSLPPTIATVPGYSISFSADDRAVIRDATTTRVVAIPSGEVLASIPVVDTDLEPRFVTADRLAETSPDQRTLRFRDARTLAIVDERMFDHSIEAFAVAPDGRIATADGPSLVIT